jgi:hypothetical protein
LVAVDVVAAVVVAAVVVAEVVLGAVVVVGVDVVSATVSPPPSFVSAPKTSTAPSIPKKKTNATTMNAGSPPPGYCGRKRGKRNEDASAKPMKAAAVTASPTSCPVERASGTGQILDPDACRRVAC